MKRDTCAEEQTGSNCCIWHWLNSAGSGRGELLCYLQAIKSEFDDLVQLAAVWRGTTRNNSILRGVDPVFWEIVQIRKTGHKLILALALQSLHRRIWTASNLEP